MLINSQTRKKYNLHVIDILKQMKGTTFDNTVPCK